VPQEVVHYELMREMNWSWQELQDTPAYVVRVCTDLMNVRRAAEAEQEDRQRQAAERGN
jgi:hypothetical protein